MKQKFLYGILIGVGALLFAVVAFIIVRSTATTTAAVPAMTIPAGTSITSDMLKTIQVPVDTPTGYITDMTSVIGMKSKISVDEGQLLYPTLFMTSWDDYAHGKGIPEDYVVTAVQVPAEHAVAGLITAGDYVDILGIPKAAYRQENSEEFEKEVGALANNGYGAEDGVKLYWLYANVLILETSATLTENDESTLYAASDSTDSGDYYIVAMDYSDYMKLRLSEIYFDLWMNIVPKQNEDNGPMLDEMRYAYLNGVRDTMNCSKFDEFGVRVIEELTREDKEANK